MRSVKRTLRVAFLAPALLASVACDEAQDKPLGSTGGPDRSDEKPAAARICEPSAIAPCRTLAGSYATGVATCRLDGMRWDVSGCALAAPDEWEMVKPAEREPARFATARCNDGTPFTFGIHLSPNGSTRWSVTLFGGEYCDDYSFPCSQRPVTLMTTTADPDRALRPSLGQGILSTDPAMNPDLYDANSVFAPYCSSDFWAGSTTDRRPSSGDPVNGWYFSGRANVEALFGMLIERYGMDDGDDRLRVLLGGGSAGAFGAHFNAARLVEWLPRAASGKRLALFLDAGWMTDLDDPDHRLGVATTPDRDVWTRARAFWGATFDPDCEADQAVPSLCFLAPWWYPYAVARMPVLVQQSSLDSGFAKLHNLLMPPANGPSTYDATAWQEQVFATFQTANVSWLFSGSRPYHTLEGSNDGFQLGPPGSDLRELLARFLWGDPPEQVMF